MFKDIRTWLIIGLAAVIVFLLLFQRPPADPDKQIYADSVKVLQSQKATLQALQATIISEAREREKKDSSKLAASLKEIARLKIKANQAVEAIPVRVLEENPEIMIAIVAKDSVITKQGRTIDSLQISLAFQIKVKEDLMGNHYDVAKINAQLQEMADMRIVKLEKDLKKEKRKGKLARVLIPIALIGGFLLGNQ